MIFSSPSLSAANSFKCLVNDAFRILRLHVHFDTFAFHRCILLDFLMAQNVLIVLFLISAVVVFNLFDYIWQKKCIVKHCETTPHEQGRCRRTRSEAFRKQFSSPPPEAASHTRGIFNSEASSVPFVVVPQKLRTEYKHTEKDPVDSHKTQSTREYGDTTEESELCCWSQPGQQLRPQSEENFNRGKHRWVFGFVRTI